MFEKLVCLLSIYSDCDWKWTQTDDTYLSIFGKFIKIENKISLSFNVYLWT